VTFAGAGAFNYVTTRTSERVPHDDDDESAGRVRKDVPAVRDFPAEDDGGFRETTSIPTPEIVTARVQMENRTD
jgi:hypothetical protein